MKKIFIITGEPSGDKLASTVISKLKQSNPDVDYSCVGGTHLNSLGIQSQIVNLSWTLIELLRPRQEKK